MEIKKLQAKTQFEQDKRLSEKFNSFQKLIEELNKKDLPIEMVGTINMDIDEINNSSESNKEMLNQLNKKQSKIIKTLEKELKLVTINHYRKMWLILGMSVFGIPIGIAIGMSLGNLGLLGIPSTKYILDSLKKAPMSGASNCEGGVL